ncbi:hypothetical protein BRADI_4g23820v3 [Brachypodium distachyon]|uniref:BTB domain-containing protein n=1 Tax=Brachypodium distachyon TaxID=15368 RepID=A0A2K2CPS8_BRADI|nr:hypothetical protein BRADI_4g23820v3 [Brachypodium distachyon]
MPLPMIYDFSSSVVPESEGRSYVFTVYGYKWTTKYVPAPLVCKVFCVGGHDWVVKYYPNGARKDYADFISVYLVLHSANAKDVEVVFTFTLLDKAGELVPSYSRTMAGHTFAKKGSSGGYHDFIKKVDLEGSLYLRDDDSFSFRCDVNVLKHNQQKCDQPVVIPPSNLCRHLKDLLESMDGADVIFHVGGEKFSAHRVMLAACSSVFKAEFFGAMKEKASSLIEVCDLEADSLLHFMYTDTVLVLPEMARGKKKGEPRGDVVMAGNLLVVADRYGVERLKLICERKLCNHIGSDTVATSLALAEQRGCSGLKEACFEFLASPSNLEARVASDGYKHLKSTCPTVIKELIAGFLPAEHKAAK